MMQVSHETSYKSLFIQARGVLKRELIAHLRSRRVMRRGKTSTAKGQPRGQIIDAISIRQRLQTSRTALFLATGKVT